MGPLHTHCQYALLNFNPNDTCKQQRLGNTTFIVAAAGTSTASQIYCYYCILPAMESKSEVYLLSFFL